MRFLTLGHLQQQAPIGPSITPDYSGLSCYPIELGNALESPRLSIDVIESTPPHSDNVDKSLVPQ